jgi:ADP-ribosyl-[dinitrogen reductase] hydrolase
MWCLLNTDNYADAVLKSVNLGDDTDTTAAVTGGLAALIYGFDSIPNEWLDQLARKEDIEDLAMRMSDALS